MEGEISKSFFPLDEYQSQLLSFPSLNSRISFVIENCSNEKQKKRHINDCQKAVNYRKSLSLVESVIALSLASKKSLLSYFFAFEFLSLLAAAAVTHLNAHESQLAFFESAMSQRRSLSFHRLTKISFWKIEKKKAERV